MVEQVYTKCSLSFAVLGCVTQYHLVTDGNYVDSSGAERILVQGSKIHFDIKLERQRSGHCICRTYTYTVGSDGTTVPYAMASTDAAFGIAKYDRLSDGGNIVRLDPKTGESLQFQYLSSGVK